MTYQESLEGHKVNCLRRLPQLHQLHQPLSTSSNAGSEHKPAAKTTSINHSGSSSSGISGTVVWQTMEIIGVLNWMNLETVVSRVLQNKWDNHKYVLKCKTQITKSEKGNLVVIGRYQDMTLSSWKG